MDVFKAIADPKRRDMIALLAQHGPTTISTVCDHFTDSRQATTKHLNILQKVGLVIISAQGRQRYCQLNLDALTPVKTWISFYDNFWNNKLDSLEAYLAESKINKP